MVIKLNKIAKTILIIWAVGFVIAFAILIFNQERIFYELHKELNDFSIQNLSDSEIISSREHKTMRSSTKYDKGTRSGVDEASKYEDSDKVNFSCKKILGIKRVSVTKAADCTLTLNISSTLTAGEAEIVVICDNEILERFDCGETKTFNYDVTGEHIYSVKILCENAELEIEVTREMK